MTVSSGTGRRQTPFPRRIPLRFRTQWFLEELWLRMPWVTNEGEATARVVDMAFDGYPLSEKFETKAEAVGLLEAIWNIIDNWDGSRLNVGWAKGRVDVRAWATGHPEVAVAVAAERESQRAHDHAVWAAGHAAGQGSMLNKHSGGEPLENPYGDAPSG